ncbi:MAG TPA: ATP-binding protein [Thermoanaerobaculia bacterium]|nr:ATP-binding protein [Thermoanaerobaculia bacterium]
MKNNNLVAVEELGEDEPAGPGRGAAEGRRLQRPGEDGPAQTQSMEAMGRLAGGIAHVFNNLLTAMACETELALARLPSDDPARKHLREIERVGERGATLARQLLAFSGRQVLAPKLVQLNALLSGLEGKLRNILGGSIELKLLLSPDLDRVLVDAEQIEQVVLNLASNARDAMLEGVEGLEGERMEERAGASNLLVIETQNQEVRNGSLNHPLRSSPGRYAVLKVIDNGPGMPEEVRRRVFEPFFSTKGASRQGLEVQGLGLSMTYGIVAQSGGQIVAESEPGQGSQFLVYLPSAEDSAWGANSREGSIWETLLLVEDEENVRKPLAELLKLRGYNVLEAADGPQALQISERHRGPIHLMVTDVLMGNMSGVELAERLAFKRPEMKVLFATGYPAGLAEQLSEHSGGSLYEDAHLLKKPFSGKDLAAKVREVLEERD